ncbi:TWF1 [Candida oxycetoniae]|uniref:TWF1 n=1 Tax=Candida oxycetoniae TaxID=497107 RepID=A0AAI9SZZ6_9ASCO|nr:TWF1 [Candida oxycetoniae]KAI3406273.2 TWF1 [Candida oxycetoniae]
MSTQSGIVVSQELLDVFNTEDNALVVKISPDSTQLIPDKSFTFVDNSPSSIISSLHTFLAKEFPQPSYIIVPYDSTKVFISFIPDSAAIKQKMLYASTKSTLLASLGSYNFKYKFSWTELDEVDFGYLEKCVKEERLSGPLSKDEELLQSMNQQHSNYAQLGFKRELVSMNSSSSDILYQFDEKLETEFNSLVANADKFRLVIFSIDVSQELIKLDNIIDEVNVDQLIKTLADNVSPGPKYIIYNYSVNEYAFIYTCPSKSSVKDRMIYAASKNSLINLLKTKYLNNGEVTLNKNLEVGDLDELDVSQLHKEDGNASETSSVATPSSSSSTTSNNGLRFSKPKGPRRR